MKPFPTTLATALMLAAGAAMADGDFSEGSQAKEWNVFGVEKARFEARVVDAVCALTGDCPEDCGAGLRQMALIRAADGVMVLANKNAQAAFTGAGVDLAPYCNQTVTVDGLLVGDPEITPGLGAKLYQVQTVTTADGETHKANLWTRDWAAMNPDATGKGPWFRRDPRILSRIGESGYFGLGPEVDEAYIRDNY